MSIAHVGKLAPFIAKLQRKEHCLLLALGDSNTCNTAFTRGAKQWPELLHSELRDGYGTQSVLLLNSGISGHDVLNCLNRWDTDVARFHADAAVICLGANDRRLKPEVFRDGMIEAIRRFESAGTAVLLRTPAPIMEYEPAPPHIWRKDTDLRVRIEVLRDVAATCAVPLVDLYAAWHAMEDEGKLTIADWMTDAVHLNAIGHREVCRATLPPFGLPPTFAFERSP